MTRLLALCIFVFGISVTHAQIETPAPSPLAKVTQVVGITEVEITYSRPGIKGREIFGGLVPYNEVWRTGANASTKLSFSSSVTLEGNDIPAGTYSLYTIPNPEGWEIIINKKLDSGGRHVAEEDLIRFKVKPGDFPRSVERFYIGVEDMTDNSATIFLRWHKTEVPIRLEVPTKTLVMESIDNFVEKGDHGNAGSWYQAARYFYDNDVDTEKALEMVNKSLELNADPFWVWHTKALILAKLERNEGAVEAAKMSMQKAEEAGNTDFIRLNEELIKELQ